MTAFTTNEGETTDECRLERYSHADSPVVGIHAKVLAHTGKHVSVSDFTDSLEKKKAVPIMDALIAFEDCEFTGNIPLLIVRNALHTISEMHVHLIPPFIMCLAGDEIDECPKFLAKNPSLNSHSLYFPDQDIQIHWSLHVIISFVPC
jgi:hypothetical protein